MTGRVIWPFTIVRCRHRSVTRWAGSRLAGPPRRAETGTPLPSWPPSRWLRTSICSSADHRGISHSLGAACVAGLVAAWVITAQTAGGRLAAALAWASHILLDWLSNDTRPPLGVMALWPFTRDYYKAAIEIFPPVSRRFGMSRFWIYNLTAAIVELADPRAADAARGAVAQEE